MKNIFTRLLCAVCAAAFTIPAVAGPSERLSRGADRQGAILQDEVKLFRLDETLVEGTDYVSKKVIFKIKPEYRAAFTANACYMDALNQLLNQVGVQRFTKTFPEKTALSRFKNDRGEQLVDLSLVYEFTYSAGVSVEKVINRLYAMGIVQYAEPHYIPKLFYNPNDPNISSQPYLSSIKAYTGWDISKGNSTVVIGITDTGTDLTHPDLTNNIAYNTADPINGSDDDGDGYLDNYQGWDVGMNDNNPQWEGSTHGVGVSGLAAASTDNGTGIASPGFNCKFLPVKIADNTGALVASYTGVTYAADHGCQIINCSWGGTSYSQFAEDVVNYATFNRNSLVVAAAGNTNADEVHYPGSYENVFNVAGFNTNGRKGSYSTYGYTVDVGAPGTSSYSTTSGGGYGGIGSGTSYSSPLTAGCAAVVKAYFPSYTALQVGERLRITADNVDAVTGNATYAGKLGSGMVNLYRALNDPAGPSVRMGNITAVDNEDNIFVIGDTLYISGTFTNYLAPTSNLTATISTASSYVSIIDNSTTVGALATLASANNSADPFKAIIQPSAPPNAKVSFTIDIQDGSYSTKAYFDVIVNVDYINVTINEVKTTVTSKGRHGYNLAGQLEGLGFTYKDSSLLYEAGLMLGVSSGPNVSDNVRGDPQGATDEDFQAVTPVAQITPPVISQFDLAGTFNDNPAGATKLSAFVKHKSWAWNEVGHTKYIIVEYTIFNQSGATWSGFHAAYFADWDIMDYLLNNAETDAANQMGYVYSTQTGGIWAGIRLLTAGPFQHYGIDNDGTGGSANIYDGYPAAEKYTTISTSRPTAGTRDVASVVSSGPHTVNNGDSIVVAFALIAGDDINDITTSGINAKQKYDLITSDGFDLPGSGELSFRQVYPNPAGRQAIAAFFLDGQQNVSLGIYDVSGRLVKAVVSDETLQAGAHIYTVGTGNLPQGSYYVRLSGNNVSVTRKVVIVH